MKQRQILSTLALSIMVQLPVRGVSVTREELTQARDWTSARFEAKKPAENTQPGLFVLANHDPVIKNARAGQPLNLAGAKYSNGLYCHAFSKIKVRLPKPGQTFSAIIGVDSNEQTSGGRGSVDFSVTVADVEKFRSGVLREGMPGRAVELPLDGATEFVLQIEETPDGIACDQSDWAEAKVVLADGEERWLADLPLTEVYEQPLFAMEAPFTFTYGGTNSAELLKSWAVNRNSRPLDENRTESIVTYSAPQSAFSIRCVAIEYHDFPTVEWTLYFKNAGRDATAILQNIQD